MHYLVVSITARNALHGITIFFWWDYFNLLDHIELYTSKENSISDAIESIAETPETESIFIFASVMMIVLKLLIFAGKVS